MKKYVRNHLFAEPSFAEGIGRILDIGATLQVYNVSDSENDPDTKALANDWFAVGDDFRTSIEKYESQTSSTI